MKFVEITIEGSSSLAPTTESYLINVDAISTLKHIPPSRYGKHQTVIGLMNGGSLYALESRDEILKRITHAEVSSGISRDWYPAGFALIDMGKLERGSVPQAPQHDSSPDATGDSTSRG